MALEIEQVTRHPLKTLVVPIYEGREARYRRQTLRWYVIAGGESRKYEQVEFEFYDKPSNRISKKTEQMLFSPYGGTEDRARGVSTKVLKMVEESPAALFAGEIAASLGIGRQKVSTALTNLRKSGKIQRRGYFDPRRGEETCFAQGYLYFLRPDQYERKLAEDKGLLSPLRLRTYDKILLNTKIDGRFTPQTEIQRLIGKDRATTARFMQLLCSIRPDIKSAEIGGSNYYWIDGILSDDEIQEQKEYWGQEISEDRRRSSSIGHCHEDFCQTVLSGMHDLGELQLDGYRWDSRISHEGKIEYNVFKKSATSNRKYEFDRVLRCSLAPFGYRREVVFIFEFRYKRQYNKYDWDRFIQKLADTSDFGTSALVMTRDGREFPGRIVKHGVIPVMILAHAGDMAVKIREGETEISLAQYISGQGGIVLFTNELEKWLGERLGRRVNFKRLWGDWFKNEATARGFAEFLIDYLSGSKDQSFETLQDHDATVAPAGPFQEKGPVETSVSSGAGAGI